MDWNDDDSYEERTGQGKWTRREKLEKTGLSTTATPKKNKASTRATTLTPWLAAQQVDPGAGHRHQRLQHILMEEVRGILRDEVRDRALANVRVRTVELSPDYRTARIRVTLGAPDVSVMEALVALENAETFIRTMLSHSLEIKRMPALRFVVDPNADDDDVG